MNIHRLEEDGGGGDKFESRNTRTHSGLSHCTSKGLCGFSGRVLSWSYSPGTCALESSVLWIRLLQFLFAPPLSSHSGCPNLGRIIFLRDSFFFAQAARWLFLKEHSDDCYCDTLWLRSSQQCCHWLRNKAQWMISRHSRWVLAKIPASAFFLLPTGSPPARCLLSKLSHLHGLGRHDAQSNSRFSGFTFYLIISNSDIIESSSHLESLSYLSSRNCSLLFFLLGNVCSFLVSLTSTFSLSQNS